MIHLEDVRHLIAAYFIAKLDRYEGLTAEEHSTPGALLHAMGAIGQTHDRANAALRGHRVLTMLLRGRSTNPSPSSPHSTVRPSRRRHPGLDGA
jgi:hypothetical protein